MYMMKKEQIDSNILLHCGACYQILVFILLSYLAMVLSLPFSLSTAIAVSLIKEWQQFLSPF